jgi:hypothetical protein
VCGLTVVYYWTCRIVVGAVVAALGNAIYQWAYTGRIDWWQVVGMGMYGAYMSLPLPFSTKVALWLATKPWVWNVINYIRGVFGM